MSALHFNDLEQLIFKNACETACQQLKTILETLDNEIGESRDKLLYRSKGFRTKTIKTLMGNVTYSRSMYKNTTTHKYVYLLDDTLNISTIGTISQNVITAIVEQATKVSFRNVSKNVSDNNGFSISHGGAWKISQQVGASIRERYTTNVEKHRQQQSNSCITKGGREVDVLFEEADGTYINLQGMDRKKTTTGKAEIKLAIAYEGWKKTGKNRFELHNKTVVSGIEDSKTFFRKKEARIASIYNMDEIKHRILNSDGAAWLKTFIGDDDTVCYQLDPFHKYQAIIQAVPKYLKKHKVNIMKLFHENKIDEALEYIDTLANSMPDENQEKKLRELYAYLKNNYEGLIPYANRVDIGEPPEGLTYRTMGVMENNIGVVIADRMKGRRANWSIEGARNLSAILCEKHSGTLDNLLSDYFHTGIPEKLFEESIIEPVLSSNKTPTVDGNGYEGRRCGQPYDNSKLTLGRKIIRSLCSFRTVQELISSLL